MAIMDLTKPVNADVIAQALNPQGPQSAATGIARLATVFLAKKAQEKQRQEVDAKRKAELANIMSFAGGPPVDAQGGEIAGPPGPMDRRGLAQAMLASSDPRFQNIGLKNLFPEQSTGLQAGVGKYNPGDFTPESWADFAQGGFQDPRNLKRYEPYKNLTVGGVNTLFSPSAGQYREAAIQGDAGATPITTESIAGRESQIDAAKKAATKSAELGVTQQFEAPKAFQAAEYAVGELDSFKEDADALLNHPGLEAATGFGGETVSGIPGTEAANFAADLNTLKSKSFISALSAMRAASKTGGAVGNVSDAEGAKFENKYVSLQQAQSPEQFRERLKDLTEQLTDSQRKIKEAYKVQYGNVEGARMFEETQLEEKPSDFKFLGYE